MRIDWVTLVAQLVNFAILVALLKRFLYGRIIDAIDRREQMIAQRIADAEQRRADADREAESLRADRRALEDERSELLGAAERDAQQRHDALMAQARKDVADAQARWSRSLERQRTTFLAELRRRAGEEMYETTRSALRDLADTALEERILTVFERRVDELSEDDRQLLAEAATRSGGVVVRSAFEIVGERADTIRARVAAMVPDVSVRFETLPDLIAGIELVAGERTVGWSLHSYLSALEAQLDELLETEARVQRAADQSAPKQSAPDQSATEQSPGEQGAAEQSVGDQSATAAREAT